MIKHPDTVYFDAEKSLVHQRINVYAHLQDVHGNGLFIQKGETVKVESGTTASPGPLLSLRHDEAKELMDVLWSCGIRPSNGEGNAGQLGATQAHLKDMQSIAMAFINTHVSLTK